MRRLTWIVLAGLMLIVVGLGYLSLTRQSIAPLSPTIEAGETGSPAAPVSEQAPLLLDEYWQQVEATRQQIAQLQNVPIDAARSQLSNLAAQWENIRAIRLADDTIMPVDHNFIVARLRQPIPDLDGLEGLLAAMQVERQNWPAYRFSTSQIEALQQILAQPEFQWQSVQPSLLQQWWEALVRKLYELLSRLLGNRVVSGAPILEYILLGLGVLTIGLVGVFVIRSLWGSVGSEAEIDPSEEAGDELLTAESAMKKALELSTGGDYRLAVRYLYLSSLLLLEERGMLRYDRSKTNREYLRSVANNPEVAANLGELVNVFDRVWYGYQPIDQVTFERYTARVASLRRQK